MARGHARTSACAGATDATVRERTTAATRHARRTATATAARSDRDSATQHPLAGQSGSWLDPSRAGEGIELLWTADGNAVLGWYTYTPDGDPFWLIGLGQRSGEGEGEGEAQRIVFPALYSARGGRFGEQYDPTLVERLPWGRLELDLGCSTGTATFQSDLPAFGTGTLNLRLLTRAAQTPCPWTTGGLSQLYSIHTAELPASTSPSPAPANSIEARIWRMTAPWWATAPSPTVRAA